MKKIAIFAEGQTEQLFVTALIEHIAELAPFRILSKRIWGGRRFSTIDILVAEIGDEASAEYDFLVLDCGSDSRVASEIAERYESLIQAGYEHIFAVRDLSPDFRRDEFARLIAGMSSFLPSNPVAPQIVIAVMEVEAWLLAEVTHFAKLNEILTIEHIHEQTGIDIEKDAEERERPSVDLNIIYELAGLRYKKTKSDVTRTLSVMDFSQFNAGASDRAKSISPLISGIGSILQRD